MTPDDRSSHDSPDPTETAGPAVDTALVAITAVAVIVGVILRFWPRSSLWLDEALTVNISTLPLSDIGDALRRDGHPPLFYYLLNLWTSVVGTSDWWVRALSGVISVISFPLAYLAGRRLAERRGAGPLGARRTGLIALTIMAMLPYGIRYGSETRQYALTIALVTGGYLLVDDLLSGRSHGKRRLAVTGGAALVTASLLWSHYWSMWLLAVVGVVALHRAFFAASVTTRAGGRLLAAAMVLGGVLFLPWVPNLLYQTAHTGTPWGKTYGPVEVITVTIQDFSGDALTSYVAIALVLLAVAATIVAGRAEPQVMLTSSFQPRVRAEAGVLVATMVLGWLTATVSGNTYASRYAAVVFPLFVLAIAAGVAVIRRSRTTVAALAVLLALSLYGTVSAINLDRTQAGQIGDRITVALAADDGEGSDTHVVVACPDQIGVALQRVLTQNDTGVDVIPYPEAGDARFVNWVDYEDRNTASEPQEFVERISHLIGDDTTVHVVAMTGYNTFDSKCEELINVLSAGRPTLEVVEAAETGENMGLWTFGPTA